MLEMHSIGELLIWYFGIAMSGKTSSEFSLYLSSES